MSLKLVSGRADVSIAPLRDKTPAHLFVAHHLVGAAGNDFLAEIHRKHPVDQGCDALDVVVDQEHRAPLIAEAADHSEKVPTSASVSPAKGLVDQHHLGIPGDGLGELKPAQIRKRQRRRAAIHHGAKADAVGDPFGAFGQGPCPQTA